MVAGTLTAGSRNLSPVARSVCSPAAQAPTACCKSPLPAVRDITIHFRCSWRFLYEVYIQPITAMAMAIVIAQPMSSDTRAPAVAFSAAKKSPVKGPLFRRWLALLFPRAGTDMQAN